MQPRKFQGARLHSAGVLGDFALACNSGLDLRQRFTSFSVLWRPVRFRNMIPILGFVDAINAGLRIDPSRTPSMASRDDA